MSDTPPRSEPILNVPGVVSATAALLVVVHVVRAFLDERDAILALALFAFIPARYDPGVALPGGLAADVWTFVSYAALHGDIVHLLVNLLWMLGFGSAVAVRFGAARWLLFFVVTSAAGALGHLLTHAGEAVPMVGASAAISGFTAAAARFAFAPGAPLDGLGRADAGNFRQPALSLAATIRNPRAAAFVIVWFAVNLLFGLGTIPVAGEGVTVAWQAHIGGFVAGLLLFPLFDPVRRDPPRPGESFP